MKLWLALVHIRWFLILYSLVFVMCHLYYLHVIAFLSFFSDFSCYFGNGWWKITSTPIQYDNHVHTKPIACVNVCLCACAVHVSASCMAFIVGKYGNSTDIPFLLSDSFFSHSFSISLLKMKKTNNKKYGNALKMSYRTGVTKSAMNWNSMI